MATYNYMKPVWKNGAMAVSDAPGAVLASIETVLGRRDRRRNNEDADEPIRIEHDDEASLTIAWIVCPVSLRHGIDVGSSYRTGKFIHAIAMDDRDGDQLTLELGRALFESVHGPEIEIGVASHEAIFEQLVHPDDADVARQLFVTSEPRPAWQRPTLEAPVAPPLPPPVAAETRPATVLAALAPATAVSTPPVIEATPTISDAAARPREIRSPEIASLAAAAESEPEPIREEERSSRCAAQSDGPSRVAPAPEGPVEAREATPLSVVVPGLAAPPAQRDLAAPSLAHARASVRERAPHDAICAVEPAPSLSALLRHRSPNPVAHEQSQDAPDTGQLAPEPACDMHEIQPQDTPTAEPRAEAARDVRTPEAPDTHQCDAAAGEPASTSSVAANESSFEPAAPAETATDDRRVREAPSARSIEHPPALEAPAESQPEPVASEAQRPVESPLPRLARLRNDPLDSLLPPAPERNAPAAPAASAWRRWPLAAGLLALGMALGVLASRIEQPRLPHVSSAPPPVDAAGYERRISSFEQELEAMRAQLDDRSVRRAGFGAAAPLEAAVPVPLPPRARERKTPPRDALGSTVDSTPGSGAQRLASPRAEPPEAAALREHSRLGATPRARGRVAGDVALATQLALTQPMAASAARTSFAGRRLPITEAHENAKTVKIAMGQSAPYSDLKAAGPDATSDETTAEIERRERMSRAESLRRLTPVR